MGASPTLTRVLSTSGDDEGTVDITLPSAPAAGTRMLLVIGIHSTDLIQRITHAGVEWTLLDSQHGGGTPGTFVYEATAIVDTPLTITLDWTYFIGEIYVTNDAFWSAAVYTAPVGTVFSALEKVTGNTGTSFTVTISPAFTNVPNTLVLAANHEITATPGLSSDWTPTTTTTENPDNDLDSLFETFENPADTTLAVEVTRADSPNANDYSAIMVVATQSGSPDVDGTTVGYLESMTSAILNQDGKIAGRTMTRTRSLTAEGAATIELESTHGMTAPGTVGIDGIVYAYTAVDHVNVEITGVTHDKNGATVVGAFRDHPSSSTVMLLNRDISAIDKLRRGFLINYATGKDLEVIGRNLRIFRLPALSDDETYRAVIKALAYNPRGTVYGFELFLDAVVGNGNYEIIEYPDEPGIVYITVDQDLTDPNGKTWLQGGHHRSLEVDNVTVNLADSPLSASSVRIKDENHETSCAGQRPSADTLVEYEGDAGTTLWTWNGISEVAKVTSASSSITFSSAIADDGYQHTMRGDADAVWSVGAICRLVIITDEKFMIEMAGPQVNAAIVFAQVDATHYEVALWDPNTQTNVGSAYGNFLINDEFNEFVMRRTKDGYIELLVDGVVVSSQPESGFTTLASMPATLHVGRTPVAGTDSGLEVRSIRYYAHSSRDYWAGRHLAASVASGDPDEITAAGLAFTDDDVGKRMDLWGSSATNPSGGNNNCHGMVIDNRTNVSQVDVSTALRTDGSAVGTNTFVAIDKPDAFVYPDDLGKKITISGSSAGNDGDYIITGLNHPDTGDDLDTLYAVSKITTKTNSCELDAVTALESNVSWVMEPVFVTEGSLTAEMSDAGDLTGSAITLRIALTAADVVTVQYGMVLTGQLMDDPNTDNEFLDPLYTHYPFYVFDLLAFIRPYLVDLSAAGIHVKELRD